jgi:hypothetical protein
METAAPDLTPEAVIEILGGKTALEGGSIDGH